MCGFEFFVQKALILCTLRILFLKYCLPENSALPADFNSYTELPFLQFRGNGGFF